MMAQKFSQRSQLHEFLPISVRSAGTLDFPGTSAHNITWFPASDVAYTEFSTQEPFEISGQQPDVLRVLRTLSEYLSNLTELLRRDNQAWTTWLVSLGADGLSLRNPIPVTVREDGDEFIASFLDANISAGGETLEEAIDNLQSLIVDIYEQLESLQESRLGSNLKKQRLVLRELVCRISRKERQQQSPISSEPELSREVSTT